MNEDRAVDLYLAAVERSIGFPYEGIVVSVVEECFDLGYSVEACVERLEE